MLFFRSPWGQDIIVNKVTNYVSNKTHTKVEIEKLYITFSGDISLEGLYLEDKKGDTLVYSKSLEADIPIWPIIKGNAIGIDGVDWNGLKANIYRKDSVSGFNYQFLVDAFASDSTATKKQTSQKPMQLSVGSVNFENFDLSYNDEVTGLKADAKLGKLALEGEEVDLEKMKFHVAELSLENTDINYAQTKPIPPSDSSEVAMPILKVDRLILKKVYANYQSIPQKTYASVDLREFLVENADANLPTQSISVDNLVLNNSDVVFQTEQEPRNTETSSQQTSQAFSWPEWKVKLNSISLENNSICVQQNGNLPQEGNFNPQAIDLADFNFKANNLFLGKNKKAIATIEELSFQEASGFNLKKLAFSAELNNESFQLNDLSIATGNSNLSGNFSANYTSIENFIENPEKTSFAAELQNFNIAPSDAYLFSPELKKNPQFQQLAKNDFQGSIIAEGTLSSASIKKLQLNWGNQTRISTSGTIANLTEPDNVRLNLPNFNIKTVRKDVLRFVSEKDLGISVPENIQLNGSVSGTMNDFKTNTTLKITEGEIKVNGNFTNQGKLAFDSTLEAIELDLGKLLENPNIGKISLTLQTSGSGENINTLDAELSSKFSKLEYSGYDFSALELDGKITNGSGNVKMAFKDDNLNFKFDSQVELDSVAPKFVVDLDLIGANLYALGITKKDIRTKVNLNATFKGNAERFDLQSTFTDGVAVYDNKPYYLGDFAVNSSVRKDSTSLDISSSFLKSSLNSNANPTQIGKALQRHMKHYFTDSMAKVDTLQKPVNLKMDLRFYETPIISEVFAEGLQEMDTLTAQVDFSEQKQELKANIRLPHLNFQGNTVDSLAINIDSDSKSAVFDVGFANVKAGPLQIAKTTIDGNFQDEKLALNFSAFDKTTELYHIQSEIDTRENKLAVHINPEKLILNKNSWSIPASNAMVIQDETIAFTDFTVSRNGQELTLSDQLGQEKEHWGVELKNFKLATLMSYFNPDEYLASGEMNGNFIIVDPFTNWGMIADLGVNDFKITQIPLGKLSINAKSKGSEKYDFDLGLKGSEVDLDLTGDYAVSQNGPKLNLDLAINEIQLTTIEKFLSKELKNSEGSLSGKIAVSGTTTEPDYKGYFQFNNAAFNVSRLNTKFTLADERINIDNDGIYFNTFSIADVDGNKFTLTGDVLTEDLTNPKFKLDVTAKDFQALNSTKEDNELYYGKAIFDLDAKLRGDLNFPKLDVDLTVNEKTDLTYVIPETQLSIQKRDGVVIFVNKENPDNILTENTDEEASAIITGIELNANLKVEPNATFNIVINERTGDNLQFTGEGDLKFNIARNGRTTLTGRYDVSDGHYEMNLYNLVKRKFEIDKSSSVTWQGDPMNADLDIKAIYRVETSASSLMSSQTAGESLAVRNRYKQKLPFLVYLNVDGELMQPRLTFSIDMPEDSQGAIGGSVYGKVSQLNQQEDQLNKQVFSLLVLNRFYPESGSDGSQGGAANIARENINQALTDQLNMLSDKFTGNTGVELSFGVNSYTDYQGNSAQERTDVAINAQKKLLDDRLIVQAGSDVSVQGENRPGEANPVIGNVSIEYLLTENGRWRIRGFRKSEYENVIDGQVFVSGIALIFTREFNKFKELWDGSVKEETEKNQESEEKPEEENTSENNKKATSTEEENEEN
ncbi:translocation/assembly module TamB domain-containing protein [Mesonia maritima]